MGCLQDCLTFPENHSTVVANVPGEEGDLLERDTSSQIEYNSLIFVLLKSSYEGQRH